MQELDKNILKVSLEYLYWFSRFEYTLKENGHLKSNQIGNRAIANWDSFRDEYLERYSPSNDAYKLIELHPKQQIIGPNNSVNHWEEANISHCSKPLCKVIVMLKTVRNNLFHGGKHYSKSDEEKKRDLKLVELSLNVIKEIANINSFGGEVFEPSQDFDLNEIVFN